MSTLSLHHETHGGGEPWIIELHVFDILNEYLQPSSATSPTAAAQKIDSLFPLNREEQGKKEEPESFLWEIWELFGRVAQQIPWKHPSQDRLAELVKALCDLPSDMKVEIWGKDSRIWQDLPLLGPALTEMMNSTLLCMLFVTFKLANRVQNLRKGQLITISAVSAYASSDAAPQKRQRWCSLNAFEARLTRHSTCSRQYTALCALRGALESEPDPRSRAYHQQGPVLGLYVPVAAEWIFQCGHVLFASKESWDSESHGKGLWKEKPGFSPERWQYWKQRFLAISEHDQASAETKQVAKEAAEQMAKVENKTTTL